MNYAESIEHINVNNFLHSFTSFPHKLHKIVYGYCKIRETKLVALSFCFYLDRDIISCSQNSFEFSFLHKFGIMSNPINVTLGKLGLSNLLRGFISLKISFWPHDTIFIIVSCESIAQMSTVTSVNEKTPIIIVGMEDIIV